jgi:hypothetical protein
MTKETELQLFANIFFVFFHDPLTGRVRVRTIPVNEIEDVITDKDDSKTPLYYKRRYIEKSFDTVKGKYQRTEKVVYYPDWNNSNPVASIGGNMVSKNPVYHVKVNSLGDMKFGVSEIYAAQDWAKAYKGFLEDWATIAKSLAKFTWRAKTSGGKSSIQNMKSKLDSTLKQQDTEKNPAPPAGSTFISGANQSLEPIKLAGVNMRAEDGDKMIHMVCAATGIFYHYLVGDPSTGNLATAKAMERPMEIMFRDRQIFWTSVFQNIFQYVIMKSIEAPQGKLSSYASLEKNEWNEWIPQFKKDTENPNPEKRKQPISDTVNIEMPELLEKDTEKVVNSIINGATLGGRQPQGVISNEDLSRLLMMALGMENIDEKISELYPEDGGAGEGPNQNQGQEPNGGDDGEPNNNNGQAESQPDIIFRDAVKDMRDSLKEFVEYYNSQTNGHQ